MEGIEEPSQPKAPEEYEKDNSIEVIAVNAEPSVETDVCHTSSNGVAESEDMGLKNDDEPVDETTVADDEAELATKMEAEYVQYENTIEIHPAETDNPEYINEIVDAVIPAESLEPESAKVEILDGDNTAIETEVIEESVEIDGIVENNSENMSFETEIFIENNTADMEEVYEEADSSNILSELGQNIELSEVLRSTDVCESVENNNCEQEVFNKEELLDILEGNDTEQSRKVISENFIEDSKKLEEHLARQQLDRLKGGDARKRSRNSPKKPEKKQPKRSSSQYASKDKLDENIGSQQEIPNDTDKGSLNAPKETRGKAFVAKEIKAKVNAISSTQNASKEVNDKSDEKSDSQNTTSKETKRKVTETMTGVPNASKRIKTKVSELNNSQNVSKEVSGEITEAVCLQTVAKEAKGKVDVKITSNKTPKEAKSKAKGEEKPKKESIVNSLVQDWSDDEPNDNETNTILDESKNLLESTEELVETQGAAVQDEGQLNETEGDEQTPNSADTTVNDEQTPSRKSEDETQPQRRLGRLIKKKVIYDPDNPDTFTKTTKVHVKKEKETPTEKEATTPKKLKTEQAQVAKTKSPLSKMQWKKPQPKSNRQSHRRLTEIDKLLMDEGAVNMICQLTPEALKGNKNMKSKAEFIKNIQSNTPDTKEMKFRERKSKTKTEEGESKNLGSTKQRLSLSSSIKSPAVSDDFENHSADDSIIYRRHSSSSYSSSCMSPRRLSDVDGGSSNQSTVVTQIVMQEVEPVAHKTDSNLFMSEKTSTPRKDIMNKTDCLSIKEKLNSKLSLALNKRKLSSFQMDKPLKVKKVEVEEVPKAVTLSFNQKVAEICIRKAGSTFNVQVMKALENILLMVSSNKEVTVTLITSEDGNLCTGLDLKPIVGNVKKAHEIADHARSLMHTLESHSKLILIGVEGKIQGFGLALAALSDVLLASENTTFSLAAPNNAVMHPGAGVLSSRALSQELLNELIVFGRALSASEAVRGGLVSRVIWPDRFQEQVRAIAMDIATQPFENVKLKKQLVSLTKATSPSTFQAYVDKERDLLVNYWTSDEGMGLLRDSIDAA